MKRLSGLTVLLAASALILTGCTSSPPAATTTSSTSAPVSTAGAASSSTTSGSMLSLTVPSSSEAPPSDVSTSPPAASVSPPSTVITSGPSTVATSAHVSSTKPSASSSKPSAVETGPWPSTLSSAQVGEAKAALTAYEGYEHLVDQAYMKPGQDWSKQAAKLAADPERSNFLSNLKATAQLGQYTAGTALIHPQVTKVQPALVHLSVCMDSTNIGFFDKSGKSIKAPNQAGSFYRHPSQIDVGQYVGGQWLVTVVTSDFGHTC